METSEAIFKRLQQIGLQHKKISLITVFKSIPLSLEAEIIGVDKADIFLQVHRYQWAICKHLDHVYLMSDEFQQIIKANSVVVDPYKMVVTVSQFEYAGDMIKRRAWVRVVPDSVVPVILLLNRTSIRADLIDISVEGMSLSIDPNLLDAPSVETGLLSGKVELLLRLPGESAPTLRIKGAIRDVFQEIGSNRYRIGLQTFPDKSARQQITRYVNLRQATILKEIDTISSVPVTEA